MGLFDIPAMLAWRSEWCSREIEKLLKQEEVVEAAGLFEALKIHLACGCV